MSKNSNIVSMMPAPDGYRLSIYSNQGDGDDYESLPIIALALVEIWRGSDSEGTPGIDPIDYERRIMPVVILEDEIHVSIDLGWMEYTKLGVYDARELATPELDTLLRRQVANMRKHWAARDAAKANTSNGEAVPRPVTGA